MTDPHYADMKQHKRDYDWLEFVAYAHYCIPKKCACGGPITVDIFHEYISRIQFIKLTCQINVLQDDGLHIRHDCLAALEEELDCLRSQYAEEVSLRRELQFELAQMREETKELKQLIMVGR